MVCHTGRLVSGIHVALRADGAATLRDEPLTLDGQTWIVADARVDDRETLAAALGVASASAVSDAELILRAFMKWDDRCLDHLLGDFAFAIWNDQTRRLWCARDHLGVKPLHYADAHGWLLVSSSVTSLRQHPAVSDALDDLAVADFLMFGHKTDPGATTFRDIRRVPPAHTLTWSPAGGCRVSRYWELPIDEPVYRKDSEYAAALRELVDRAVADRMRGERVSVFFSGGLDSTVLAARARRHAGPHGSDSIRAFSILHESLLGDTEREPAAAAAAHLQIRCEFYEAAPRPASRHVETTQTPEPLLRSIDPSVQLRCLNAAAAHSGVAFTGEGPDNALVYEWASYVRYLWRARRVGRLAEDFAKFLRHHRRLPLGSALARVSPAPVDRGIPSSIPSWISGELVERADLEERWRFVMRRAWSPHPTRPAAWFSLQLPLWQDLFDTWHPSYTGAALDVRHPFLDLRVLRFLLSVPVVPWCREKYLLRYAFAADLPPQVRRRPKTPLPGSPDFARIRRDGLPPVTRSPRLDAYVSLADPTALSTSTPAAAEAAFRLVTFSHWLSRLESTSLAAAPD